MEFHLNLPKLITYLKFHSHLPGVKELKSSSAIMLHVCLFNVSIDSFTISLHSPNGRQMPAIRAVQGDCQWPLKNGGNSHWSRSHEPTMHCMWGVPQSIFGSANHTANNSANRRPCLIAHWQSYCHQVRTVKQSMSVLTHGWQSAALRNYKCKDIKIVLFKV